MVNEIAVQKNSMPSLAMTETELMKVLESSLYPSAQPESIKLVIGYCKAAGLDPIQKPVHIVPMWDSKAGKMRDVIMPGIGAYRTQAARSGEYAGVTEPEFGTDVNENIGGTTITYPSSCKVTVKRLLPNGTVAEFSANERWKENYAVRGGKEKSIAPNTMWVKRPYAQLAKCAEAQALRKAFPEFGAQPTADEMEGKSFDGEVIDHGTGEITAKKEIVYLDQAVFEEQAEKWRAAVTSGRKTKEALIAWIDAKGAKLTEVQLTVIHTWKPVSIDEAFVKDMEDAEVIA